VGTAGTTGPGPTTTSTAAQQAQRLSCDARPEQIGHSAEDPWSAPRDHFYVRLRSPEIRVTGHARCIAVAAETD
jgi:hypothetical protein